MGLKENVIIGQLIPAGTGMKYYRDIDVLDEDENELKPFSKMEEIEDQSESENEEEQVE